MRKLPSGVTMKINFIFTNGYDIMKNLPVLNNADYGTNHRMIIGEIKINLRKEGNELIRKPPMNLSNLQIDQ